MAEQSLPQKLQMKTNSTCLILKAPAGYMALLADLPGGGTISTELAQANHQYDFVQVFVASVAALNAHAEAAVNALKPGGLLWFCYPKKTSSIKTDINRDVGWDALAKLGFEGIRAISIDDTWSGMRFRPREEIKRKPDSIFLAKK